MVSYKTSEAKKRQKRNEAAAQADFNSRRSIVFPGCIGKFPECENYKEDMPEEERKECLSCPHRRKQR